MRERVEIRDRRLALQMPGVPGGACGAGDGLPSQAERVCAVLLEEPSEMNLAPQRGWASMAHLLTDDVLGNARPGRLSSMAAVSGGIETRRFCSPLDDLSYRPFGKPL